MNRTGFIIFIILAVAAQLLAYRPFITEDATTSPAGEASAEISWDYLKISPVNDEHDFITVLSYGLTNRLEFSAEIPYIYLKEKKKNEISGVGDVLTTLKYLVFNERKKTPSITFALSWKADNGDPAKGLGTGGTDWNFNLAASKMIGPIYQHLMLGFIRVGGDDDVFYFGTASDFRVTEKFWCGFELTGDRRYPHRKIKEDLYTFMVGFNYYLSPQISLDASCRWGLTDVAPDLNIALGTSFIIW